MTLTLRSVIIMLENKKIINAGDESTNIQGKTINITNNGLSYSEVKEVAMDVFKSNFYDLGEKASKIASERAEEITNKFLRKLQEKSPDLIGTTAEPDIRYGLYEIQKSHARYGEKEIAELLVDILVQRTTSNGESFMKLVLNEALTIIPKLTTKQIDILTLIYVFRYLNFKQEYKIPFEYYYVNNLRPLITRLDIPQSEVFYQHLQYSGCLSISVASSSYLSIMQHKFSYLNDQELDGILNRHPELINFREKWDNTKLCNISLTSVGIAIGLINANRKLNTDWDLGIWIHE